MTQPQDPHEPVEPTDPIPPAADQESSDQQPGYPPPPPPAPSYSQPTSSPPAYGQPAYGQGGYAHGIDPAAPYGVHPVTGVPYSDKSKLVAGLLQLLIPLGIGRMYIGDTRTGVIQLVVTIVTCGLGALWPFVDGILMLVGDPVDSLGRPLRT
ncbi:MAG: TM2 domain-containing protein [Nocardioides sp.]